MLTGRELIIYILENHLEDEPIFDDGIFLGFMSENEAAVKFKVGTSTIRTWYSLGMLKGVTLGNAIYIPVNAKRPEVK